MKQTSHKSKSPPFHIAATRLSATAVRRLPVWLALSAALPVMAAPTATARQIESAAAYQSAGSPRTPGRSLSRSQAERLLAQADEKVTTDELTALLQNPNMHTTAANLRVATTGSEVSILAEAKATESDQELKIDAMFISKTLIEGTSGKVHAVKVLFSQPGKDGRFIIISKQTVDDFGSGKIAPDKMLSSLLIHGVHKEEAPKVAAGPEFDRRLFAWQRIEKLKEQGTGVKPFEMVFDSIETLAKSNKTSELSNKLTFLESKLSEQEEIVKQAKKAAQGHGISRISKGGQESGSASGSGNTPSVSIPLPPLPKNIPNFIPPNADELKADFNQRADGIIQQVQANNSQLAQQLRDDKRRIEQCFSSGKLAEAFYYIHEFHQTADQAMGGHGGQGGGRQGGIGPGGGMGPGGGGPPF